MSAHLCADISYHPCGDLIAHLRIFVRFLQNYGETFFYYIRATQNFRQKNITALNEHSGTAPLGGFKVKVLMGTKRRMKDIGKIILFYIWQNV